MIIVSIIYFILIIHLDIVITQYFRKHKMLQTEYFSVFFLEM